MSCTPRIPKLSFSLGQWYSLAIRLSTRLSGSERLIGNQVIHSKGLILLCSFHPVRELSVTDLPA